jgi:hypothetical protein
VAAQQNVFELEDLTRQTTVRWYEPLYTGDLDARTPDLRAGRDTIQLG